MLPLLPRSLSPSRLLPLSVLALSFTVSLSFCRPPPATPTSTPRTWRRAPHPQSPEDKIIKQTYLFPFSSSWSALPSLSLFSYLSSSYPPTLSCLLLLHSSIPSRSLLPSPRRPSPSPPSIVVVIPSAVHQQRPDVVPCARASTLPAEVSPPEESLHPMRDPQPPEQRARHSGARHHAHPHAEDGHIDCLTHCVYKMRQPDQARSMAKQ